MQYLRVDDPDELMKYHDNTRIIQNQIIDYLIYLKNPPNSLRYATRSQYLAAIMTFYELNEVVLNKRKIHRYLGEEERPLENRGYNVDEITKMLDICDEHVKALILILASTGVRIRATIDLKLEDLKIVPNHDLFQVRVYSNSRHAYSTFTTPEATKAINNYLDYRERCGEKLTPISPLFRNQFDRNDSVSIHNTKPLKLRTVERLISRAIEKSGIRSVERQTEFHNDHGKVRKNVRLTTGFRKFFDTQLILSDVKPVIKEMFMGHSIGLDVHYFKPSGNDVLQEYLSAIGHLTINQENTLKKKVRELTSKHDEIETLREKQEQKIKEIHKQMDQIFAIIQQNPKLAQIKPEALILKRVT